MAISSSDIIFFRSGDFGLGGEISATQLEDRLFKDVPAEEVASGTSDYMCLYIKNNNQNDSMYRFGVNATDYNYSDVQIGFPGTSRCIDPNCSEIFKFSREKQKIVFIYKENIFGEFRLFIGSTYMNISWFPNSILDPTSNSYLPCQIKRGLAQLFSHSCNDVCSSTCQLDIDVTIDSGYPICGPSTPGQIDCTLNLTIEFPAGKSYDLIKLERPIDFFLEPDYIFNNGRFDFTSSRLFYGGPINSTAKLISNTKIVPQDFNNSEITFFNNSETIVFEELSPGDYLPVWVKRLIPAGSVNVLDDGFTFNISTYNTLETTQPPTTAPFVLVDDQKQETFTELITTEIDKSYWQVFKAGYTGKLRIVQLGFYGTTDPEVGSGHLRLYKEATPQIFNVIYSSPISVTILPGQPAGVTWNTYSLNIDVEKDKEYTIGYFPKFAHRLPLNGNNVYLNGYFGIDTTSNPNKDMLFRTQVFTNMTQ
jgi:hypothetical protein